MGDLHENVYIGIVCIYLTLGFVYVAEGHIPQQYIGLLLFFFFKMFFYYERCTISYLECKLRNVKKEDGYLYDFLHSIIILRNTPYSKYFYICAAVLIILFIKQGSIA
jgi:hypothetical protein